MTETTRFIRHRKGEYDGVAMDFQPDRTVFWHQGWVHSVRLIGADDKQTEFFRPFFAEVTVRPIFIL